jgi:hypothetical protein
MHRSGTSALARILNLFGAVLPKNIMNARPSNPSGHWEPERLVALHDRMLAETGSRWDDWRGFDPAQLGAERLSYYKAEIIRLITEEYENASLFILKDPRICRFVPLYEDVLSAHAITTVPLLIFRNPLSVIASLEVRDGMTARFASFVWLRHVVDAEIATRGKPRAFISYEGLLSDWHATMDGIGSKLFQAKPLATQNQSEIETFLSYELRHHASSLEDLMGRADITAWVKDAYRALLALEKNCDSQDAITTIDKIRASFNAAPSDLTDALFSELWAREGKPVLDNGGLRNELISHEKTTSRQQNELNELNKKLAGQEVQIDGIKRLLAERDETITIFQRTLAERDKILSTQDHRIASIYASNSWKITMPLRTFAEKLRSILRRR